MPPTLEDIAQATGFDKSTVSVTLRNLPRAQRFSEDTRKRIHAAAQKLGYRPNFFAQSLSEQKTRLLMLCLNYLKDPFAMMVAEGFEARASSRGYRVLITALQESENPFELHRDILGLQGVPAMAVVGGASTKLSERAIKQLAADKVKIVLVNRRVADPRIAHISADDYFGGESIAKHIYGQGLRNVWVLHGMEGPAMEARLKAFRDVAREFAAPEPTDLICTRLHLQWMTSAAQIVRERLKTAARPPEAIITVGDVLAVGASQALAEAGLAVGRDVALTGYDGGIFCDCVFPPLTTVRLPMAAMGSAAADSLIGMLEQPTAPVPNIVLPVEVMIRASSTIRPTNQQTTHPGG
jgi:LacI family transcriptional regulator